MRNTFLLQEILLENRIDDVKKKYPNVSADIIERLSTWDPSGDNKYLDFIVNYYNLSINENEIIEYVKLFHTNVNKLSKEVLDEIIAKNRWEWLLSDSSPIGRTLQGIYKSPKDINQYKGDWNVFKIITDFINQKLSKTEIKKLDANILYSSDDILIMIPKSYKASCYYGSGTKWCTTNKDSDNYYKRYTETGTLIYYINKKENQSNDWYKAAFFIDKSGESQAFDAPDRPTSIKDASENLGNNWPIIRDTIIEYLYANNLKGVDNFYFGPELITWLESKGLDPLKVLDSKQMAERVGADSLMAYLKKRDVSLYTYLPFLDIFNLLYSETKHPNVLVKEIWNGYKEQGINPIESIITLGNLGKQNTEILIDAVVSEEISLDEFLHMASNLPNENNIFKLLSKLYRGRDDSWWGSDTFKQLFKLFKNDVDLIFGFAETLGINLFESLDVRSMNHLLSKKYDKEQGLKYALANLESLKSSLTNYGFPSQDVVDYITKFDNRVELFKKLNDSNLLGNLALSDYVKFLGANENTFWVYYSSKYKIIDDDYIQEIIKNSDNAIRRIFPTLADLEKSIQSKLTDGGKTPETDIFENILYGNRVLRVLIYNFYNGDYYSFYKDFMERGQDTQITTLMMIKAYEDAPVGESDLKEKVLKKVIEEMKGTYSNGRLTIGEKSNTVTTTNLSPADNLCNFTDFFESSEVRDILCGDDVPEHFFSDEDALSNLDDERILNLIREHLMTYFRGSRIKLPLEWVDEFDEWAEDIDEVEDTFTFDFQDERIYGMSDYKLEFLINKTPRLSQIKDAIRYAFTEANNNLLKTEMDNHLLQEIVGVFGGGYDKKKVTLTSKTGKEKVVKANEFGYHYLMDDIIAYANANVWAEETLPDSVVEMISQLMKNSEGRFDSYLETDVEYFVDGWMPDRNKMMELFADNLYRRLNDIEY